MLQLLCLLAFGILGIQAASVAFPFDQCTTYNAGNISTILFCTGPNSIPNRYIVKFQDDATASQILTHLEKVNGTFPGSDCSLGDFSLESACGNCTNSVLGSPPGLDGGIVICSQCDESGITWQQTNRAQPSQCGFNYIYDSSVNSTFRGYSAALSTSSLKLVLQDPIVFSSGLSRLSGRLRLFRRIGLYRWLQIQFLLLDVDRGIMLNRI
jgi:hypothetical protein